MTKEQEPFLEPWQFFLLGGMLAATATVIVATGQSPANIIILSLTVVSVSFVGMSAYKLLSPLVTPDHPDMPPLIGGRTRIALEREKQLVLRSLKELEFDFAMRKMSQVDYDEMSHRLRARAFGLMRQLDAGSGYRTEIENELKTALGARDARDAPDAPHAPDAPEAPARRCLCGAKNDADARFCKSCGSKL